MTPVNKPFLPPQKEYNNLISKIWETQWLTNNGSLVKKLELDLTNHLKTNNLLFVNNGTTALQLAIKALDLRGEIITTPFSFVATTSSIVWENCKPIFVDINNETLNIDPIKIEAAITSKTSAILATHVFGNPCDVEAIEIIAKKHNIKVIYDGAHAFGIKVNGKSIFDYGDISICSTHATKIFHTIEGGFLVTKNITLFKKLKSMRNFGFKDSVSFSHLGINAKNSEFHAAMGILNLKYFNNILDRRKELTQLYDKSLKNLNLVYQKIEQRINKNYSFYPILLDSEKKLLSCVKELEKEQIFARRYFYPSLSSSLNYIKEKKELPIAEDISSRILCLPLFYDLDKKDVKLISGILVKTINDKAL
ncbi:MULTISPECIES: DegT/DnrJ/EryC1/StrS family aminotransferase [Tenacibaculum]|uniref:DegT/DnrJ/EryC1/StrS family aminotransferase n=1 Tax=Tenacibaculum TaxID=104267 RepID=UPI001F0B3380|nr:MULTISPECIES: DegT/DnrJ/EryC1/StrS family aminotransferase [Tenacibaculum]MCH3881563.1 DegT/DnrJ/EryC1/StrS family aminotransferase [Tenacibaculum aquimarinum]MDO6598842.1 DegT/DnrJ/EryC1/StrS family aminotransferase [Tenacibaculum sp. 1_MG-2023]